MPIEADTSSEPLVNFVSLSRIANPKRRPTCSRSEAKFRASWDIPVNEANLRHRSSSQNYTPTTGRDVSSGS